MSDNTRRMEASDVPTVDRFALRRRRELARRVVTSIPWPAADRPQADIAIVSSPRSGSTWLLEALARDRRYVPINEPDHKDLLAWHKCLRVEPRWAWVDLTADEREDVGGFLTDYRRTRIFGPARPREALRCVRWDRRILKLIRMNAAIEWIKDLGFDVVYLIRHPIPQAMSCIRRGHTSQLADYAYARSIRAALSRGQLKHVTAQLDGTDAMASFVTQWCLENLIPLRVLERRADIMFSSYEHRVLQPATEVARLAQHLRAPVLTRTPDHWDKPSRVTDSSTHSKVESIRDGTVASSLGDWRHKISPGREEQLLGILRVFGLDTYSCGSDLPSLAPGLR